MKKKEKPPYWQNHFYEKESYPPKKHKKRKNSFTKTPKSYISIKKTLFFAFYFIFLWKKIRDMIKIHKFAAEQSFLDNSLYDKRGWKDPEFGLVETDICPRIERENRRENHYCWSGTDIGNLYSSRRPRPYGRLFAIGQLSSRGTNRVSFAFFASIDDT